MSITTHVLDTSMGKPAAGVHVRLSFYENGAWRELARGATDLDGRCKTLLPPGPLPSGLYRLTFETGAYFERRKSETFYPRVSIHFDVKEADGHCHVPLLLSPWGYSTYRGS